MIQTRGKQTQGKMARWNFVLAVLLVFFAVLVTYIKHNNRLLFIQWQSLLNEYDQLVVRRNQLTLESSALSSHARTEQLAKQQLQMLSPSDADKVIIRP